jgi:uncharacterized membrane protein
LTRAKDEGFGFLADERGANRREDMRIVAELGNYLESHKMQRVALLAAGFVVASVSLYMAVAAYLFIQYASVMIAVLLLFALSFDVGIAWLLQHLTRRSFWLTIVFTSCAVVGGAIVVSMGVLREHWVDTVKELLKELLHS